MSVIEASGYRLECDAAVGGIVRSLTWDGLDLLRPSPIGEADPLKSGMFPLVPFSNRLSENVPSSNGELKLPRYLDTSALAIHGFGWQRAWEIVRHDNSLIEMVLDDQASPWPSAYQAVQRFELGDQGFLATLTLTNIGSETMPAGIGFHPYFPKGNCRASMQLASKWEQDALGLPSRQVSSEWSDGESLEVAALDLDHSFSGWDGSAQLDWPQSRLSIDLTADENLREVVVYSPDENYFCIEPVSHLTNAMFADAPEARRGWRELQPGESMTGSFRLRACRL